MAKSIVLVAPVAVLESRIAWRSEPGPLSAVVVTTKTPSRDHDLRLERRGAVGLGVEAQRGVAVGPARRRVDQARPAPRRAPRAGRCRTAIRSHRPSRSGRRCSTASASRPRPRASGPTSGRAARHRGPASAMPSPDAAEKTSGWPATQSNDP